MEKTSYKTAIKEVFYGMAFHDMIRLLLKDKSALEHLFILVTMGDIVGVPIMPPYYTLRILPYAVPHINSWKRRMLREKDLTDILF
ncbi:MAG: hypothetical protein ACE5K0_11270 [Candidatus Methanofastidiosia archaeon]